MRQIVQNARSGRLELAEVPVPAVGRGQIRVRTAYSVVSPGTETLALAFARKSLLAKARSRPDLVRQVTRKLRQEGPLPTYRAVMNRLDAPQPLGYSSAGRVDAVGEGVTRFAPGDRVACAGAGYANHAEFAVVPENLAVRVPENVALEHAAFATLGAIALQGVRIAAPTLGEVAAVIGLGLIGQLAVQLLRANGCRVLGIDLDAQRVKQAASLGAEWGALAGDDHEAWSATATEGHGADLALVTASSESPAPLELAARLSRLKGRVVVVGAVPIELDRRALYAKELELRMSTSYGPGRYDRRYEELGLDYPLPYVRWTENRNLAAFLGLLAGGAVRIDRMDAETVPFEEAVSAYDELSRGQRRALALVFRYGEAAEAARTLPVTPRAAARPEAERAPQGLGIAFLGAGAYARGVLLPALGGRRDLRRVALVTQTGPSARQAAERFGFERCSTDPGSILADPGVQLVFVATRHDSHAALATAALRAGKAVWLEKPVGLTPGQVREVIETARETRGFLTVGYNRRFSRHARAIREVFQGRRGPLAIHYRIAAGPPPRDSWILDPEVGGGRIVGELCHFVDLCIYWIGSAPERVFAERLGRDPESDDSTVALLRFPDGSTATLEYLARAHDSLPKEEIEISGDGRSARCVNFRLTELRPGGRTRTWSQDKGQRAAVAAVLDAVAHGAPSPFSLEEIEAVSSVTFAVEESARTGRAVELPGLEAPLPEAPRSHD